MDVDSPDVDSSAVDVPANADVSVSRACVLSAGAPQPMRESVNNMYKRMDRCFSWYSS